MKLTIIEIKLGGTRAAPIYKVIAESHSDVPPAAQVEVVMRRKPDLGIGDEFEADFDALTEINPKAAQS